MNDQQKNSEENKDKSVTSIVIVTIIIVVVIVWIISAVSDSNSSSSTQQQGASSETSQSAQTVQSPAQPQSTNEVNLVALKSKCATDGSAFVRNYEVENNTVNSSGYRPVWQTPEYHYNTRLNTCIVYVGYFQVTYQSPLDLSSPNSTEDLMGYNFAIDIYSNQAVLQNVFDRVDTNGENTDTLSPYPNYSDIENMNWATFNQKMQVLMNE